MKKKLVKKENKPKTDVFLELEGSVHIVEKKGKKIVSREKIDGKAVLQCLLSVIKEAVNRQLSV